MVNNMIFIDSGFLYSYMNDKDNKHKNTLPIMKSVFSGEYGKIIIANYITDETLTLARVRTGNCQCSKDIKQLIKTKKGKINIFFEVILDRTLIESSELNFERYCDKGLSFTDCSILAVMQSLQIENLASFDCGFKGLVKNLLN